MRYSLQTCGTDLKTPDIIRGQKRNRNMCTKGQLRSMQCGEDQAKIAHGWTGRIDASCLPEFVFGSVGFRLLPITGLLFDLSDIWTVEQIIWSYRNRKYSSCYCYDLTIAWTFLLYSILKYSEFTVSAAAWFIALTGETLFKTVLLLSLLRVIKTHCDNDSFSIDR